MQYKNPSCFMKNIDIRIIYLGGKVTAKLLTDLRIDKNKFINNCLSFYIEACF